MGDQETNTGAQKKLKIMDESDQKRDPILMLSDAYIVNVFQYLSVKEKFVMERVCKRFNKLSKLSWSNMKKWDIQGADTYYGKQNEEKVSTKIFLNQILDRCASHLENINILCDYYGSSNKNKKNLCPKCPKVIRKVASNTGNIQKFKYHNYDVDSHINTEDDLKLLFLNNTNLLSVELDLKSVSGECFSALPFSSLKELNLKLSKKLEAESITNSFSLFKVLKKFTFHGNESTLNIMTVMLETLSKNSNITEDLQVCVYLKPKDYCYDGYLNSQDVGKIFLLKKNLRTLSVRKVMVNGDFLSNLGDDSNIEKIYFDDCNVAAKDLLHYLPKFKNLYKFSLSNEVIDDSYIQAIALCQNLRYLILKCEPTRYEHFSCFPNLEYLEISTEVINDDLLADIAKCKQLKTLMLSGFYESYTDWGFSKISHLSKLEYLSFGVADRITDKSLSKFVQLKKIFCCDCNGIRDEGLCTLIRNSPNLEVLSLSSCKNITNKLIIYAITHKNIVKDKVLHISIDGTKVKLSKINISSPFVKVGKHLAEECLEYDDGTDY